MNFLILANKTTGQVEAFVASSGQMPPASDMPNPDPANLSYFELWDKTKNDLAIAEITRLVVAIDNLSAKVLDPDLSEKAAATLLENRDRLQTDLDSKRAALRPFVEGEISRDMKLIAVDSGFRTEFSLNPVQPIPPPLGRNLAEEIDALKVIAQDHEARLRANIVGHTR